MISLRMNQTRREDVCSAHMCGSRLSRPITAQVGQRCHVSEVELGTEEHVYLYNIHCLFLT